MWIKTAIVGCLVALLVGVTVGRFSEKVSLATPPQDQWAVDSFCAQFAKATGQAFEMADCVAEGAAE
jgi:hypothetical protein